MKRSFWGKLKIAIICLFILLPPCFAACSSPTPPNFPIPPFEGDIRWSFNGMEFTASISMQNNSTQLHVTSPDCLSGSILYLNDTTIKYTYQGITLDTVPEYYLAIAKIFAESGEFKFLCRTEIDGQSALCYSRKNTEWYFSEQTKAPILAKQEDLTIKILNVK